MTRAAVLFLLFSAMACHGQIELEATPEPMAVTGDIPVKVIGLWDLRVCNDAAVPRFLYPERVFMARWQTKETAKPSGVRFLTAAHARRVLETRQAKNKKQIAAELISIGLEIAVPLLAWDVVAASKKVIGAAAVGGSTARIIQGRLASQVPSITMFTDELLTGPVTLAPAECTTRAVFASKMKNPETVVATIQ